MNETISTMKTKTLAILIGLAAPLAFGDPSEEALAFCKVKGAKEISIENKVFAAGELAAPLLKLLRNHDFGPEEEKDTYQFTGFTYDLNKDGQPELFVYSPTYSGSGGSAFLVFSKLDSGWKKILDYQGSFWVFPSEKGWPRIAHVGHAGSSNFAKVHSEFKDTQYANTLIVRYIDGKVTEEIPQKTQD